MPDPTGTLPEPPPYIEEFRDVRELADGTWTATHASGQVVTAINWRTLIYVKAPALRSRLGAGVVSFPICTKCNSALERDGQGRLVAVLPHPGFKPAECPNGGTHTTGGQA